jgi:hypothetical protein
MIATKKAKELVAKFLSKWYGNSVEANIWIIENIPVYGTFDQMYTAKECALLAIDEFLPIISSYEDALFASQCSDEVEYWNEVKNEIQNL